MPVSTPLMHFGVDRTDAIEKGILAFGKTASKTAIVQGQRQALKPMLKAARQNAPVRTGDSAKSIKIISVKPRSGEISRVVIAPTGSGFVLLFAEKGTFNQPAKPWLAPAESEHERFYIKHFRLFVAQKFRKVAERMVKQLARGKVTVRTARILSR